MTALRILLFGMLATFFISSEVVRAADAKKGPPVLMNHEELPAKYRDAVERVAAVLTAEKEAPREFKAEIEERDGGRLFVFHLWHKSAFEPENKGAVGNPGGRCRDVIYDTKSKKASQSLFWQ